MRKRLLALWKDEGGVTSVEYALLLSLIVLASVSAWSRFGLTVRDVVSAASNSFGEAASVSVASVSP